jgi:hypothetical protein
MWLELQVRRIAERIVRERKQVLESKMAEEPAHTHGQETESPNTDTPSGA